MKTLKHIMLIVILFVVGFIIRDSFFEFSISQLNIEKNQIAYQTLSGQFFSSILLGLSIGIIPILYLIIKRITKLNFINHGLICCVIIIFCGVLSWQLRVFQLNNQMKKMSAINTGNGFKNEMYFENLYLETYLLVGFLFGTILSILIFKNRTKEPNKTES